MLLVGIVVVLGVAVLPFSLWLEGLSGSFALGAAVLICLTSGLGSLIIGSLQVPRQYALYSLLLAMAVRIIPPLAVCLLLAFRGGGSEYLGFVCYLVLFYIVTLSVETYVSIRRIHSLA